jgi:class 3 adenylate cyclase
VSFDISEFSRFCLRPDAHGYLNRYLASLFDLLDNAFADGWRDLLKDISKTAQISRPDFAKYTGDGALLLWVKDKGEDFTPEFCTSLVAALRHFQVQLPSHVLTWQRHWRTSELPQHVRLGLATGPVYPLSSPSPLLGVSDIVDYAGYCINLSVRLQEYARGLGFVIHAPLHPDVKGIGLLRARKMKGAMDELVYVFDEDWNRAVGCDWRDLVQSRFSPVDE